MYLFSIYVFMYGLCYYLSMKECSTSLSKFKLLHCITHPIPSTPIILLFSLYIINIPFLLDHSITIHTSYHSLIKRILLLTPFILLTTIPFVAKILKKSHTNPVSKLSFQLILKHILIKLSLLLSSENTSVNYN